jgi:hypothetical protein
MEEKRVDVADKYEMGIAAARKHTAGMNGQPPTQQWHSCCFTMDKPCVVFSVQTLLGAGLLVFSSYRLTTEPDCDRAAPYWGLIGTLCGFFFNRVSVKAQQAKQDRVVGTN